MIQLLLLMIFMYERTILKIRKEMPHARSAYAQPFQ